MSFYEQLLEQTADARATLLAAPVINRALTGTISRADYLAFLGQAYHHVKHTVPLLMAVGASLPDEKEWLRTACAAYIAEEVGHQEWVLNDIAALGGDKEAVRHARPLSSTEMLVAYAWDQVNRVDPLGFLGMVLVLEGTSVAIADQAATSIQQTLDLPASAFSYLRTHGALDQAHVRFFADLINRIEAPAEQAAITHAGVMFYRLYGDMFRELG